MGHISSATRRQYNLENNSTFYEASSTVKPQHNCSPSNDTVRTHGSLDFGVLVDVVLELGTA